MNNKKTKKILTLFIAFLATTSIKAANADSVRFWVETPDTLEFGKSVEVTYHLHTNEFRDAEWPQFTNFQLSSYHYPGYESYFNKTHFHDFEWKMNVAPMKSGAQTLPTMTVMIGGQKVSSEQKDIYVKGQGTPRDALILKALQKFWSSDNKIYEPTYREKPKTLVFDVEMEAAAKRLQEKGQLASNIWLKTVATNAELIVFSDDWNRCFAIVATRKHKDQLGDLVLAYSTESNIENHTTLVDFYTEELKSLSATGSLQSAWEYMTESQSVSPLLGETRWGQQAPFNAKMPLAKDGKPIVAGAGGVALAQVMRYHQYPMQGKGKHYYQVSKENTYGMNFEKQIFRWEKMKDEYSEVETDSNVATIVSACAYALETHSPSESMTHVTPMRNFKAAMVNFFNYDTRCAFVEDTPSNLTVSLLHYELDNRRPVVCEGISNYFVADGYDGDFFHLNMGWKGYFNGYYRIALSSDDENSAPLVDAMLIGVEPSKADSLRKDVTLEKPGMLAMMLTAEERESVTHLKVKGKLGAKDMMLIRDMAGGVDVMDIYTRPGRLEFLDLEDATFVTDKETPYMQKDASGYTYTETSYMQYGHSGHRFTTGAKSISMGDISHDEWNKLRREKVFRGKGFQLKENKDSKLVVDFTLKKSIVTPYLFANCDNLKSILLPSNTKSIEDAAFANCNSLKYIVLPVNVETVTEGSFMMCYNLENVYYISNFPRVKKGVHGVLNVSSTEKIKGICDGAFAGNNSATCKGFKKLK